MAETKKNLAALLSFITIASVGLLTVYLVKPIGQTETIIVPLCEPQIQIKYKAPIIKDCEFRNCEFRSIHDYQKDVISKKYVVNL